MKVQEIVLSNNSKRYLVVDDDERPIYPVAQFIKYLDSTQKSPNTQRTYCYGLRDFFLYLSLTKGNYENTTIRTLANYLSWLVNPTLIEQVQHFIPPKLRAETTVNLKMTAVLEFYKFLYQFEYIEQDLAKKIFVDVKGVKKYKDFLHHINKDKLISKSILKVKEPRKRIEIIPDKIIQKAFKSTTNTRDLFLLCLLYESGMRIGEVLSLYKEDIIFDLVKGHHIRLSDRNISRNDARLKTGVREIYISSELIDLFDDYMYSITDFDKSDSLFIKIKGALKGESLQYNDVASFFRRIESKIGYHLHPHLYRHTHATKYYEKTKNIKAVQERLGHSQIQTTINRYLHPTDEEIQNQWKKASKAFRME